MFEAEEDSLRKSHEARQSRSLEEPDDNLGERNSEGEEGEIGRRQSMQDPVDRRRGFSLARTTVRLLVLVGSKPSWRWGRFLFILIQILYLFFFFQHVFIEQAYEKVLVIISHQGNANKPQRNTIALPPE